MRDYDVIVIGSGSGGLTAATALARAGKSVGVFEQHHLPGGYSQSFTLEGFSFSPGVHYIGGLEPGGTLREIYEGLGMADELAFWELNPDGYDHAQIGGERFDFPKGRYELMLALKERFPREARGIGRYIDTVCRMSDEIGSALPADTWMERLTLPVRMPTLLRYGFLTLDRFLDRFTDDPLLRAILSIQAGDHGMAPSRAPAGLHAGLIGYYIDGACYPQGGARSIAKAFAKQIKSHGGELHLGTEVTSIEVERGRVCGVTLADGSEARAPVVVSNADPGVTWGRLVAGEHLSRGLKRRLERTRYSVATISLFLGLDMDVRAAGMDSGNVWFSRTTDIEAVYDFATRVDVLDAGPIPGLFASVTTLKDPTLRRDGLHTMEILGLASYDAFSRWERSRDDEAYRRLKENLTGRMFDAAECFLPGIREGVVFQALGTPLTNRRYVGATRGAIYGTEKTVRNLGPFSFPVRTEIDGLFECGASTLSPGILGVTSSGLAAAQAVLGCRRDELLHERGQTLRIYPSEAPSADRRTRVAPYVAGSVASPSARVA